MFVCECAGVSLSGEESRERRRPSHEKNNLPVQVDEERSQEATRDPAKTRNSRFLLCLSLKDFDKLLLQFKNWLKMEHKPIENVQTSINPTVNNSFSDSFKRFFMLD